MPTLDQNIGKRYINEINITWILHHIIMYSNKVKLKNDPPASLYPIP